MADAAAFFAKKKKKKKTFKFNANTIDASQVTNTVHVDAPALSKSDAPPATGALPLQSDPANANTDDGWDDAALAAKTRKGVAVVVPAGVTTKDLVVETKALSLKTHTGGDEQKDIANKLRIEETKAKLAAAKKGMEDEALRLKEAKLAKEEGKAPTSNRFGAAAGAGGKWVSRSRAGGAGGSLSSIGWGSKMASSGFQRKVDTEDENLFPDLASADAILEKQKAEQPAYKAVTKTPVGGGATWGASRAAAPESRRKLNLKKKAPAAVSEEPAKKEEPQEPVATEAEVAPVETATTTEVEAEAAPEAAAAAPAPLKLKPKKKKKKDLSTFGKK